MSTRATRGSSFGQRQQAAFAALLGTDRFATLEPAQAAAEVRRLRAAGISEHGIAAHVGWSVTDVRRALAQREEGERQP